MFKNRTSISLEGSEEMSFCFWKYNIDPPKQAMHWLLFTVYEDAISRLETILLKKATS